MKAFRGYRDINPNQISHRYMSDGYYGKAVYLALNFDEAESYTSSFSNSSRKVVVEYEIDDSSLLILSNSEILNLHKFTIDKISSLDKELKLSSGLIKSLDLQQGAVNPTQLASIAVSKGYSGLKLLGRVEGGQQVVIPENSSLQIAVVSIKVGTWIFHSNLAEKYSDALKSTWGLEVEKFGGYYWFSYPISLSDAIDGFLLFHDSLGSDILEVDYVNKKVVYYDED